MDMMRRYPDKAFDLAIVDPPYGGGGMQRTIHATRGRFAKYDSPPNGSGSVLKNTGGFFDDAKGAQRTGGKWAAKYGTDINAWDVAPPPEYFAELFRVSKFQIIWGGNYFDLPPSRNFIVWRKLTISENFTMAMAEFAWTNIPGNAKVFDFMPQDPERFHPTQKPAALYRWLLRRYAKPGWRILDTHLGSGSIAIACHDLGFDLTGCEIAEAYYSAAVERLKKHSQKLRLPMVVEHPKPVQSVLPGVAP